MIIEVMTWHLHAFVVAPGVTWTKDTPEVQGSISVMSMLYCENKENDGCVELIEPFLINMNSKVGAAWNVNASPLRPDACPPTLLCLPVCLSFPSR
jgi:hypothetical protein